MITIMNMIVTPYKDKEHAEMKICVTSYGADLESGVDPRFGRCAYFIFVDTETMAFEAFENGNVRSGGGAGIQSAQLMSERGIRALLTGNVGPNAFQTLTAADIDIMCGVSGTVREAILKFKRNEYTPASSETVQSHSGMRGGDV
jgi:predicted Fe-Mo cluster-binding NifX family protein